MQRRSVFMGLVLVVLVGVFFYLRAEHRTQIDFEQVEPIPGYRMEMREPPLRVAMISVLNHARTEGDQSQMVRSLGRLLGRPVLLLHRRSYAEINQLLAKGDADVAFLSSGAYMVYGKKEDVRLLAMPERNGARKYYSYVIVPRASRIESLAELRGRRFGTQYIVFPNPAYGSWISALAKDYMTMSPEAREDFYAKTLTE